MKKDSFYQNPRPVPLLQIHYFNYDANAAWYQRRNHENFKLLPSLSKRETYVLDVREQEEYDALHLDGVRLLPLSELADQAN